MGTASQARSAGALVAVCIRAKHMASGTGSSDRFGFGPLPRILAYHKTGHRNANLYHYPHEGRTGMTTPRRGLLFHLTHMSNLAPIAQDGVRCDTEVTDTGRRFTDVGNQDIKSRRRVRRVPVPPGGVVADYVPFYFAARSPMLYAIHMGNVDTYTGGQSELVYLVTSIDALVDHRLAAIFTDRNAALEVARFGTDLAIIDKYVDWDLMEAR